MKGTGRKICSTDLGRKRGQMVRVMKVNTGRERSMERGTMCGQMGVCT